MRELKIVVGRGVNALKCFYFIKIMVENGNDAEFSLFNLLRGLFYFCGTNGTFFIISFMFNQEQIPYNNIMKIVHQTRFTVEKFTQKAANREKKEKNILRELTE